MNFMRRKNGFSLVEVVIAMGIVAFALMIMIGLLPTGLQANRDSVQETGALSIMRAIAIDRRVSASASNSTIYNLPPLSSTVTTTLYINDDGTTNASSATARYQIVITPQQPTTFGSPTFLLFHASWPAAAPGNSHSVEMLTAFPQ